MPIMALSGVPELLCPFEFSMMLDDACMSGQAPAPGPNIEAPEFGLKAAAASVGVVEAVETESL
jgi:hypothetical protein